MLMSSDRNEVPDCELTPSIVDVFPTPPVPEIRYALSFNTKLAA
jgi:hypothetical protein